jgi:bifunctional isochorismate lyase/aryl carrier protein
MTDATQALTLDTMRADIARILHEDPSEIGDDDSLIDLGLDSIRAMALVTRWRDAGAPVEFSELAEVPRLSHWWAVVERALARKRAGQ